MAGGTWTDTADRQLLLTIIHLAAPKLPEWNQVAVSMGEGFTAEAVRQHFQKLRKEAKAALGDVTTLSPAKAPKGTPRKAGKNPTPKKSGGKRKAEEAELNGHDEADDEESPSKQAAMKKARHEIDETD
ncbi:hypothetical protein BDY17DRAFT_323346 [Neohortaea acidophila]|uniref:Myb-like domain-containing protein n=1 Tax=Neohortaea acidophila TaxID=245834 RepID=A0A6A6PWK6_9PEZI|nr:uncharacterized protein BDY17DRAFT_323346 [Neohortaea acidophila]KAF2484500.1 hypothetical protein BDY17DRAFT_323346 [Neohortaea acidophila]